MMNLANHALIWLDFIPLLDVKSRMSSLQQVSVSHRHTAHIFP